MSTPPHGPQQRRRSIPARAWLLSVGLGLVAVLVTGLALGGVLPASGGEDPHKHDRGLKVDFGLSSRVGLSRIGAAPASFPVTLQLGLIADQKRISADVRAASDPSSPTYGHYPTLSEFARRRGAPVARRRAVLDALRSVGIRGAVDATGLRVTAPTTIGRMERLFARRWWLYGTGSAGTSVALPDGQPRIPKGLRGNVDVVAGSSPFLTRRPLLNQRSRVKVASGASAPIGGPYAGGTPTRTGSVGTNCLATDDPAALAIPVGLFPNQVLTAYGIASLHRQGFQGQGVARCRR